MQVTLPDLSVNTLAQPLVHRLLQDARQLGIQCETLSNGCTLIDAGVQAPGSLEAGRRIAEISMGALARVTVETSSQLPRWPWRICVASWQPQLACFACQLAAWKFHGHETAEAYKAIGSGPARALAADEEIFRELNYCDRANHAILVLEAQSLPPLSVVERIANDCGVPPAQLTLIVAPITSLAGMFQVAARILSTALLKLHTLQFPVHQVVDALGTVPLPPPSPDEHIAMGRANDALLYGGQVQLFVHGSDNAAQALARQLPSCSSADYGRPFAQIYQDAGFDFYKIDTHLFAPAQVIVTALDSGNSFHAGPLNENIIDLTFAGDQGLS